MAKAKTSSKSAKPRSVAKAPAGGDQPAGKAVGEAKPKRKSRKGVDSLLKLAEHPLVADLIAVGAMAAVAALADEIGDSKAGKQAGRKLASSSRAVKSAGKAAATAIGQRLLAEIKPGKK